MSDFLNVDGAPVSLARALKWQMMAGHSGFVDETVKNCSVVQYAHKNGISATAEDIQGFFNEMRYAWSLESSEEMQAFLKERGMDLNDAQEFCEIGVLRNKIRQSISDDEVSQVYSEAKQNYEAVELYRISVESKELAEELMAQIEDEDENFHALAVEHSIDEDTFRQGGFVGMVTRGEVNAEIEAAVFSDDAEGKVIGPVSEESLFSIYMARTRHQPPLDDLKEKIRDELFASLLDEISSKSLVEQVPLGLMDEPLVGGDEDSEDEEDEEDG